MTDLRASETQPNDSEEPVVELIPAMLAAFLESDREFAKYSKGRAV